MEDFKNFIQTSTVEDTSNYEQLATNYLFEKNYIKAIKYFSKALKEKPNNAPLLEGRAMSYEGNLQYIEAIADYKYLLDSMSSESGQYHQALGRIYYDMANYYKSIEHFSQCLDYPFTLSLRAASFFEIGEYDKALSDLSKSIESYGFADDYILRGKIKYNKKDYIKACQDFHLGKSKGSKIDIRAFMDKCN